VATALTNATLKDDDVVRESLFVELVTELHALRERYGNHPILVETEADFCDDPLLQRNGYRLAIRLAESNGLPTFSIRMSLADLLLTYFDDSTEAAHELRACEPELATQSDEWDMQEWSSLMRRCEENGGRP
jgi:hypothetical protein